MANQSLDQNLAFVQVEADTAYIDSRVYCREIIEVDHHDWMRDTLRNHQAVIEQYFGIVRFKTALTGKRGMPEKYALLTEPQTNFALTLSRNTTKTMERKAELIADFEQAKQTLKEQFSRQLVANLSNPIADNSNYNITCWKVWRDSGIRNPYYVRNAIIERYDHKIVNQIVCVTRLTYEDLMENFRSMDGTDISELPPEKQRKFRVAKGIANKREPQLIPDDWGYIQPNLF